MSTGKARIGYRDGRLFHYRLELKELEVKTGYSLFRDQYYWGGSEIGNSRKVAHSFDSRCKHQIIKNDVCILPLFVKEVE